MLLISLHGPSMFAVKAKIYGVPIINPALSLLMKHLVLVSAKMLLISLHGPSMFAVKAKIYGVHIINPALSLLMKHLVIGQRQNAANFIARPVNVRR